MKLPSKTDIISSVKVPNLIKDTVLRGGVLAISAGGSVMTWTGGFSIVFQISHNDEVWAFKVWHTPLERLQEKCTLIEQRLETYNLPYFVNFAYTDRGLFVHDSFLETQRMKWVDGLNLKEYINLHIQEQTELLSLADKFRKMAVVFNDNGIAHGDLQHGNIIISSNGQIIVIDYDSMYVDGLIGMLDLVKGQKGYQHPQRQANKFLNEKLDYFSILVIYLSLVVYSEMPELWDNNTEWLLFTGEDLESPDESHLIDQLLHGPDPVISYLTLTLVEFLKIDDINKLRSLESILKSQCKVTYPEINSITNKF